MSDFEPKNPLAINPAKATAPPSPPRIGQIYEYAELFDILRRVQRLIDEALPKFDWGKSNLDANAIELLNEVPSEVNAAIAGQPPKDNGREVMSNTGSGIGDQGSERSPADHVAMDVLQFSFSLNKQYDELDVLTGTAGGLVSLAFHLGIDAEGLKMLLTDMLDGVDTAYAKLNAARDTSQ